MQSIYVYTANQRRPNALCPRSFIHLSTFWRNRRHSCPTLKITSSLGAAKFSRITYIHLHFITIRISHIETSMLQYLVWIDHSPASVASIARQIILHLHRSVTNTNFSGLLSSVPAICPAHRIFPDLGPSGCWICRRVHGVRNSSFAATHNLFAHRWRSFRLILAISRENLWAQDFLSFVGVFFFKISSRRFPEFALKVPSRTYRLSSWDF